MGEYFIIADVRNKEYFEPIWSSKLGEIRHNDDACKMLMEFIIMELHYAREIILVGDEFTNTRVFEEIHAKGSEWKDVTEDILESLKEDGLAKCDKRFKQIWNRWKIL